MRHSPSRRTKHRWPVCPVTGKRRLGERKDVDLELRSARQVRESARLAGAFTRWAVIRGYRCDDCHGWHLTSLAEWSPATAAN